MSSGATCLWPPMYRGIPIEVDDDFCDLHGGGEMYAEYDDFRVNVIRIYMKQSAWEKFEAEFLESVGGK